MPEQLERLWTPHRMSYIAGEDRPAQGYEDPTGCPFCRAPHAEGEDNLVVATGETVYAVLNRYPYNPGTLICPTGHWPTIRSWTAPRPWSWPNSPRSPCG